MSTGCFADLTPLPVVRQPIGGRPVTNNVVVTNRTEVARRIFAALGPCTTDHVHEVLHALGHIRLSSSCINAARRWCREHIWQD